MSLVAWFPLNNTLTNNGISKFSVSGTPAYTTGKMAEKALDLSKQITGTIPELVGVTTWSVAFWCKVNADDNLTGNWVDIIGMRDQKADNSAIGDCRFETCYGDQKANVGLGQYDNTTCATNGGFGTITSVKGVWNHIVMVADNTESKCYLYVNGSLTKTATHNGGHLTGYFWLGQSNVVNGHLQDVRFYNHALSLREVNEIKKGLTVHFALKGTGTNPNLAINSQTLNGFGGKSQYTGTNSNYLLNGERICKSECTADSNGGPYASIFSRTSTVPAVNGNTYTWSCYIRGNREMTKSVGHECGGQMTLTITPEWQYVTHTWTYNTSQYQAIVFYGNSSDRQWKNGDWIEIKNFKIEEGSVATPYIPNSAETKYSIISTNSGIEYDLSGYGHNGTKTSIGQITDSPRYNNGIDFTAKASHLTFDKAVTTADALTMCIWAKLDSDSLSTSSNSSSNPIALGGNEFARFRIQNEGTICWYYISNGAINATFAVSDIVGGDWHHYALTWQGGVGAKFYLDGVLKSTTNNTNLKTITATSGWRLGEYGNNIETFDGQLSDFRFYATCLSADEIKELYSLSASIDNSGKLYCYNIVEK